MAASAEEVRGSGTWIGNQTRVLAMRSLFGGFTGMTEKTLRNNRALQLLSTSFRSSAEVLRCVYNRRLEKRSNKV